MTESASAEASSVDVERGSRVALAGFVFAALFVVSWLLIRETPRLDTSTEELIAHYTDPRARRGALIAGLYLIPFAAVAFVWFVAALRDRYVGTRRRENTLLSTVHLLSAALFVAALFSLAAIELALVWLAEATAAERFDADSARALIAFGQALSEIMALRSGAVFVAISTTRAMRSGLFPRWYGLVSLGFVLAMLFVYDSWRPVALFMPAWVVATSVVILRQRTLHDPSTGA